MLLRMRSDASTAGFWTPRRSACGVTQDADPEMTAARSGPCLYTATASTGQAAGWAAGSTVSLEWTDGWADLTTMTPFGDIR